MENMGKAKVVRVEKARKLNIKSNNSLEQKKSMFSKNSYKTAK